MKCGVELTSSTRSMVCGCENMMSLHDDTISAKNLSEVQIIEQVEEQIDEQGGTRLAQREMNEEMQETQGILRFSAKWTGEKSSLF